MYLSLKLIHLVTVHVTIALFLLRAFWMLRESPLLERRWVRIVPHVNDTFLLLSGLGLSVVINQYPFVQGWLTAKVIALLAYIGFGTIALKRGKTKQVRRIALGLALASVAYIYIAARTHNPLPFL